MTRLKCNVNTCAHNKLDLCDMKKITVEGPGACIPEQTCCFSFCNQNSAQNLSNWDNSVAEIDTDVRCKSGNCVYNRRGKCSADEIRVINMCSSPNVMGETECSTFRAR